ncbi:three-helix bundle dimerization domain-containing protein [Nakamurella sp. GG22]
MDPGTSNAATHRVVQRLSALFPSVDPLVVTGVVSDSYRQYVDHPNPNFVPVLVEETSRDRLRGHLEACSIRGGSRL